MVKKLQKAENLYPLPDLISKKSLELVNSISRKKYCRTREQKKRDRTFRFWKRLMEEPPKGGKL